MYRVLIVEDTPAEADALRGFLERYAAEKGLELGIEVLGSALEFIDLRRTADLVLMDIDMPGINGMEAAQIMRGYDTQTPLIFVTNLAQYAVRGYSVDALDFVVKPVEYHDFAMRLDRALRIMARNARSTMALPTGDCGGCLLRHPLCRHAQARRPLPPLRRSRAQGARDHEGGGREAQGGRVSEDLERMPGQHGAHRQGGLGVRDGV